MTVIVEVIGELLLLEAVNDGIFPLPLAGSPMDGLLLVQLKIVPGTAPEKFTAVVDELRQTDWLDTLFTVGIGFTVIVNVAGAPVAGVTVIVATAAVVPVLIAVKGAILPLPLAPRPIEVLLFVQVKVLPGTELVKVMVLVVVPLHTVTSAG